MDYEGTVYSGVVGPEIEYGPCRDSILNIRSRQGDAPVRFIWATKGYVARQMHVEAFLRSKHSFLFLMDHDMVYQPDTLEKLRSHKLPFVSGLYMRRRYDPILPVWFKPFKAWPYEAWLEVPEDGKLYEIGASGWGCALVHRDVLIETQKVCKDELLILEDDMDIWPYDLKQVMWAVEGLKELVAEKPPAKTLRIALAEFTKVLSEEIRPNRGINSPVGSDIRFPFYARAAGFKYFGDAGVRPDHLVHYRLSPNDYLGVPQEVHDRMNKDMGKANRDERRKIRRRIRQLKG